MSTERTLKGLTVRLHAAPSQARVAQGELDAALSRLLEAARQAGVAAGRSQDRDRAARALDQACERLDQARKSAAAEIARTAVDLAVEIARTLVRVEIDAGHHQLERLVRESLAASGVGRGACVVHLNPLDAAALADVRFRAGTVIEADDAVSRGDVQVSTPNGLLVREMHEALRAIHGRLVEELSS